ncbi:MAG TPA: hypothetical protein VMS43_14015 [Allosphingosinicella sp.]|nr:hypothetical protein [Allosphingosinicella sp.]
MVDPIPLLDAMEDPAARAQIENIIARMRFALAPMFNDDPENIPVNQSYALTAAALFAGITVGHMIALGVMKEQDKRRAGQVILTNFRNGIELGKNEARKAMLEQLPAKGSA